MHTHIHRHTRCTCDTSSICFLSPVASSSVSSPPATANAPLLTSVTNTRLIGVRHKIELQRGERGLGFGLSSRDVLTNDSDHPIYVKCIHSEGPAFQDGRLKLGDRILEVSIHTVTHTHTQHIHVHAKCLQHYSYLVFLQLLFTHVLVCIHVYLLCLPLMYMFIIYFPMLSGKWCVCEGQVAVRSC